MSEEKCKYDEAIKNGFKELKDGGLEPWIGVDLDGTLAEYIGWKGPEHIGKLIPVMAKRIKKWVEDGKRVKIMTARVSPISCQFNKIEQKEVQLIIKNWLVDNLGFPLEITHEKDYGMTDLWDDRAIQVIPNTGKRAITQGEKNGIQRAIDVFVEIKKNFPSNPYVQNKIAEGIKLLEALKGE